MAATSPSHVHLVEKLVASYNAGTIAADIDATPLDMDRIGTLIALASRPIDTDRDPINVRYSGSFSMR